MIIPPATTSSLEQHSTSHAKKTWPPLPITTVELEGLLAAAGGGDNTRPVDVPCPSGFTLTVYNGDISQHFNLASEHVQITRGSIKYVDHHARYGPQTRFRFQLCHNYQQGTCGKLSECSYIHATKLPAPTGVHLNPFAPRRLAADRHGHGHDVPPSQQDDPSVVDAYETLPAGFMLPIHAPNPDGSSATKPPVGRGPARCCPAATPVQYIPSHMILVTVGSETALAHLRNRTSGAAASTNSGQGSRPRHCAHYQFKRMCNLGRDCHFIHSKVPVIETAEHLFNGAAPPPPPLHQYHHPRQPTMHAGARGGSWEGPRCGAADYHHSPHEYDDHQYAPMDALDHRYDGHPCACCPPQQPYGYPQENGYYY